jgi:hypothetical protein
MLRYQINYYIMLCQDVKSRACCDSDSGFCGAEISDSDTDQIRVTAHSHSCVAVMIYFNKCWRLGHKSALTPSANSVLVTTLNIQEVLTPWSQITTVPCFIAGTLVTTSLWLALALTQIITALNILYVNADALVPVQIPKSALLSCWITTNYLF